MGRNIRILGTSILAHDVCGYRRRRRRRRVLSRRPHQLKTIRVQFTFHVKRRRRPLDLFKGCVIFRYFRCLDAECRIQTNVSSLRDRRRGRVLWRIIRTRWKRNKKRKNREKNCDRAYSRARRTSAFKSNIIRYGETRGGWKENNNMRTTIRTDRIYVYIIIL